MSESCGIKGALCQKCDDAEVCLTGQCQSKGSSDYEVQLVSAVVPAQCGVLNEDPCDTYVILNIDGVEATSSIQDGENPHWSNELLFEADDMAMKESFEIKVYDFDILYDDLLGTCKPTITNEILAAGQLVLDCPPSVWDLTFKFVPL